MPVHVMPVNDVVSHDYDDCVCGPEYEFVDPLTGESYPDGPLVVHHSLDGREFREAAVRSQDAPRGSGGGS